MTISQETFEWLGFIIVPLFLFISLGIGMLIAKNHEPNWFQGYEKQVREHKKETNKQYLLLFGLPLIVLNMLVFLA